MRAARKAGDGVPGPGCLETYRDMVRRGSKTAKARAAVHMIEGESVTFEQMAKRLATTVPVVKKRLALARRYNRPVTWQELSR